MADRDDEPIVRLRDVVKTYDSGDAGQTALNGVSASVRRRTFSAFSHARE